MGASLCFEGPTFLEKMVALEVKLKLPEFLFQNELNLGGCVGGMQPPLSSLKSQSLGEVSSSSAALGWLRQAPSLLREGLKSLTLVLSVLPSFCLGWSCLKNVRLFFEPQGRWPLV